MSPNESTFYALNYAHLLPPNKETVVLDLGCGNGPVLRFLSQKGYSKLTGVDRDQASLDEVRDLKGATLICADVDAAHLQQYQGRFDLIILRQMIYYVDRHDILEFMLALKAALKPGGQVIIEFFNGSLLSSRLTELKDPFIRTSYTEHSIQRLFNACGLDTQSITGVRHTTPRLRSYIYRFIRACWINILHGLYIVERGYDNELPKIYTTSIIAVAKRLKIDS